MHFTSLTSIVVLGLAVITPLVSAHPANKTSDCSDRSIKPEPKEEPKVEPIDLADCYHVSSPECDKAYDDNLAAYIAAHPDYNPNAEPYPDSKRTSNTCKCKGSLLAGGYEGKCQYGDGLGYLGSVCFPGRGMCCSWCCRDGVEGYADICVPTSQDPNCPGYGPDSKAH